MHQTPVWMSIFITSLSGTPLLIEDMSQKKRARQRRNLHNAKYFVLCADTMVILTNFTA